MHFFVAHTTDCANCGTGWEAGAAHAGLDYAILCSRLAWHDIENDVRNRLDQDEAKGWFLWSDLHRQARHACLRRFSLQRLVCHYGLDLTQHISHINQFALGSWSAGCDPRNREFPSHRVSVKHQPTEACKKLLIG